MYITNSHSELYFENVSEIENASNFCDHMEVFNPFDFLGCWVVYFGNHTQTFITSRINKYQVAAKVSHEYSDKSNLWYSSQVLGEAHFFETNEQAAKWLNDYRADRNYFPTDFFHIKQVSELILY